MSDVELPCPHCAGRAWNLVLGTSDQWRCGTCLWLCRIGDEGVMELIPEPVNQRLESPDDLRASLSNWAPTLEWSEANRLICAWVHRDARKDYGDAY